jgi:hypothetical protein
MKGGCENGDSDVLVAASGACRRHFCDDCNLPDSDFHVNAFRKDNLISVKTRQVAHILPTLPVIHFHYE